MAITDRSGFAATQAPWYADVDIPVLNGCDPAPEGEDSLRALLPEGVPLVRAPIGLARPPRAIWGPSAVPLRWSREALP